MNSTTPPKGQAADQKPAGSKVAESYASAEGHSPKEPSAIQRCRVGNLPHIYILDAGCWLASGRKYSFGLVSGSHAVVCELFPMHTSAGAPRYPIKAPKVGNKLIDSVLLALHDANLSTLAAPDIKKWEPSARYEIVVPWSDDDIARKEEILTKKDALLVLIPDCHVGIRDEGDQFSPNMTTEAIDLLVQVLKTIRKAAGEGARVVQLGDFVEVWETEACPEVYFYDEVDIEYVKATDGFLSVLADPFDSGPTQEKRVLRQVLRDRDSRSRTAIEKITERWKGSAFAMTDNKLFDKMLLGNHDIERKWTPATFYEAIGPLDKSDRVKTGRSGYILMEHGHHLDDYNDTREAKSTHMVMDVVKGKAVTYGYARGKRDWQKPSPADEKDGGFVAKITELSMSTWVPGPERACEFIGQRVLVSQARRNYSLQALAEAFLKNAGEWPSSESDPNVYQVPVRLWAHAHTHRGAVIQRTVSQGTWQSLTGCVAMLSNRRGEPCVLSAPIVSNVPPPPTPSLLSEGLATKWGDASLG